ncbi:hypothetical protein L195_g063611, partial [Trifolium pratense]
RRIFARREKVTIDEENEKAENLKNEKLKMNAEIKEKEAESQNKDAQLKEKEAEVPMKED